MSRFPDSTLTFPQAPQPVRRRAGDHDLDHRLALIARAIDLHPTQAAALPGIAHLLGCQG